MPNYATTNTWRYKVKYTANGASHTMMLRTGITDPDALGVPANLANFFDGLEDLLPADFAIVDANKAPPGSTVFVPAGLPAPTLININGATNLKHQATYLTFSYKDNQGILGDFMLIGVEADIEALGGLNWRVTTAEDPRVATAIAMLEEGGYSTIRPGVAIWRQFANVGISSHWRDENR